MPWPDDARDSLAAVGVALDAERIGRLQRFCELIETRGAVLNLVSNADRDRVFDRHLFDSIVGATVIDWSGRSVADVGSGAGLPGIPLAIALPATEFVLIERTRKRVAFMMKAVAELEVLNARPVWSDIHDFAASAGKPVDVVTIRAVAETSVALGLAETLLGADGIAMLWQTDDQRSREELPGGWTETWHAVPSRDDVRRGIRVCTRLNSD